MSGFPVHHQLSQLVQIHIHPVSDTIQPSHPLSSPSPLPSVFPSIRVFSNESALRIRWPKYWSFSISHSNEYPMNKGWFPLELTGLTPCSPRDSQGSSPTPQFKSINSLALSLLHSPTLTSIMTTGKTIALTRRTFVGKVMSLLLNMISRLVEDQKFFSFILSK